MKKLVLALAVVFGASMVACSSSEKDANAADAQGDATEVVEDVVEEATVVVDSAAADTAAADTAATDSVAK